MGTRKPAEDGALTVLASGPGRDKLGPVFDCVAAKVIDLGDEVGAGTRMKLVGNSWVLSLVEGLAETIALAERLGVDPRDFLDMIDGGPMFAPYARLKGEAMIDREFAPSFPLALAAKDAGLIAEAAPDLPLPKLIQAQMLKATEAGYGDEDMSATIRALWPEPS
jgi:3-hydroxyisobutyrate dehydrogenase